MIIMIIISVDCSRFDLLIPVKVILFSVAVIRSQQQRTHCVVCDVSLVVSLSSRGIRRGVPPEQPADRGARPDALQGLPPQRQGLRGGQDRPGRPGVHPLRPLVHGLERHGLQPGQHGPGGAGAVLVCSAEWNGQHGDHEHTVGPVPLPGQRGTALVSDIYT